jgi:hypothetical protein
VTDAVITVHAIETRLRMYLPVEVQGRNAGMVTVTIVLDITQLDDGVHTPGQGQDLYPTPQSVRSEKERIRTITMTATVNTAAVVPHLPRVLCHEQEKEPGLNAYQSNSQIAIPNPKTTLIPKTITPHPTPILSATSLALSLPQLHPNPYNMIHPFAPVVVAPTNPPQILWTPTSLRTMTQI